MKIRAIHALLVTVLCAAFAYPAFASTYNNGVIKMAGTADTWTLPTNIPGLRITHITITSGMGNTQWSLKNGTTGAINTDIYTKAIGLTSNTSGTVEVDFGWGNNGGIPISSTKGLYLLTNDVASSSAMFLYTNAPN